jgi:hypothetical protein
MVNDNLIRPRDVASGKGKKAGGPGGSDDISERMKRKFQSGGGRGGQGNKGRRKKR